MTNEQSQYTRDAADNAKRLWDVQRSAWRRQRASSA